MFVERSDVKACAALLVGGLSFAAIYLESRTLKMCAAGCGTILPAIYLFVEKFKRFPMRATMRAVDESRDTKAKSADHPRR